jgi:hypothetical protein
MSPFATGARKGLRASWSRGDIDRSGCRSAATSLMCTALVVGDHEIPQVGGFGDQVIPHPAIT